MTVNKLKLNKDRTELIHFYSKYRPQKSFIPLRFGADLIQPSQHVRGIGGIFDCILSMIPHVISVCKTAFYQVRNIARIRKCLSPKITAFLVSSKLDFCNSLLYSIPKQTSTAETTVRSECCCALSDIFKIRSRNCCIDATALASRCRTH